MSELQYLYGLNGNFLNLSPVPLIESLILIFEFDLGIGSGRSQTKHESENCFPGCVDLLAFGGPDQLTPLADAIKSCQPKIVEKLIDYALGVNDYNLLKAMAVKKTKNGKNIYQLASDTKNNCIMEHVEKLKEAIRKGKCTKDSIDSDNLKPVSSIQDFVESKLQDTVENLNPGYIHLYWIGCFLYFYKYTAAYRLHFTKLMMSLTRSRNSSITIEDKEEKSASFCAEKKIMKFSEKHEIENYGLLANFSFERSPDTVATDIRTFWELCKQNPTSNPALISVLLN